MMPTASHSPAQVEARLLLVVEMLEKTVGQVHVLIEEIRGGASTDGPGAEEEGHDGDRFGRG